MQNRTLALNILTRPCATYFAYCVQFFQQQKAFTSMRFLKGEKSVYRVLTKIDPCSNTNLNLTNFERARKVNSGSSKRFVRFKPVKASFSVGFK